MTTPLSVGTPTQPISRLLSTRLTVSTKHLTYFQCRKLGGTVLRTTTPQRKRRTGIMHLPKKRFICSGRTRGNRIFRFWACCRTERCQATRFQNRQANLSCYLASLLITIPAPIVASRIVRLICLVIAQAREPDFASIRLPCGKPPAHIDDPLATK